MGRYSDEYSLQQMIKMGFLSLNEVPKKFKVRGAVFWFAYYGIPYVNEEAEIHSRVKSNVGDPETIKIFTQQNKKLLIKARGLEY